MYIVITGLPKATTTNDENRTHRTNIYIYIYIYMYIYIYIYIYIGQANHALCSLAYFDDRNNLMIRS